MSQSLIDAIDNLTANVSIVAPSLHNDLLNRDAVDAHPISAVTGLQSALDGKSNVTHNHDADYSPISHNHDADYSPITHNHDARYYTESEVDALISGIGSGGLTGYARVIDRKSAGEDGGSFTSGAWRTRTLNLIDQDWGISIALASNQVSLGVGDYIIRTMAPATSVGTHQARYNGNGIVYGTVAHATPTYFGWTYSHISLYVSVPVGSEIFKIEHYCTNTDADGFGNISASQNFGYAIFTQVEVLKL